MSKENVYENDYLPYIIKWGRLTNWAGVILGFGPALVVAFVFGIVPPFSAILEGFIAIASAVGIIWIVEPISYFPIIGVAGTYMAFISGNIGNLRIPCAMVAQKIAGVEPGTNEGAIVATLGMAVSIVVNIVVLTLGIVAGAQVLQQLPKEVLSALNYMLPALFGAVFTQFALKKLKLAPIVLLIAILMDLGSQAKLFPGFLVVVGTVFLSVIIGVSLYKAKILK